MNPAPPPSPLPTAGPVLTSPPPLRIGSIDALRGFVMAAMIFVNDLGEVGPVVPDWLVHYSDRHPDGSSGLTFVDLVFPAFLFIVGLSLPLALSSTLAKPGGWPRVLGHVAVRTLSLLCLGVLMVKGSPDAARLGWSPALWSTLLYVGAIAAFSDFSPAAPAWIPKKLLRWTGLTLLAFLAVTFVGPSGQRLVVFQPLQFHHEWWGILGLIGWAYLVGALTFLALRDRRPALLGVMGLLLALYSAAQAGWFDGLWLARHIDIGGTLGTQGAITVGGVILGSTLLSATTFSSRQRILLVAIFIAGTATAAVLTHGLYGLSKNAATPSWGLWACAVTALLWLGSDAVCDRHPIPPLSRPLIAAGRNVFLAYLLSSMWPELLKLLHLELVYSTLATTLPGAIARALLLTVAVLATSVTLNRMGFRLRL